jgi:hypothetical protein
VGVGGEDCGAKRLLAEASFRFELGEERDCFCGLTELLVGDGEVELRGGVGLAEGEGELIFVDALLKMATIYEHEAEGDVRGFGGGNEVDDLLEVGLRGGEILLSESCGTGAIDGVCVMQRVGGDRSLRKG